MSCVDCAPGTTPASVFTHISPTREGARDAAAGPRLRAFDPLRARADGREGIAGGWSEVHERYAADLGVDPELGRQALADHPTQQ